MEILKSDNDIERSASKWPVFSMSKKYAAVSSLNANKYEMSKLYDAEV